MKLERPPPYNPSRGVHAIDNRSTRVSSVYASAPSPGGALNVRVVGSLTDSVTRRIIDAVSRKNAAETQAITISLTHTTHVQWDALCRLTSAVAGWRRTGRQVVLKVARPSHLSLAATLDGAATSMLTG